MAPLVRSLSFATLLLAVCCGGLQAQNIVPSVSELTFSAPVDGVDQPKTLTVTSSGAAIIINAGVSTFGIGHWLSVSPTISGTPASLIVTVNAAGLSPGLYLGEVILSSASAPNSPVAVPVRFTVGGAGTGALTVVPASLTFTGQPSGFQPAPATLGVTSSPTGLSFSTTASTTTGGNWLTVSPLTAVAPAAVSVTANTAGLLPGTYFGNVVITPSNGVAVTIPVTLNVTSSNVLAVSASSLQFYYQIGNFLPTSQTFDVSSLGAASIPFAVSPTTNDTHNWLTAVPLFGNTPQTVTASVAAANLPAGIYTGKITVSAPSTSNANVDVPVTLTVANGPLLTVSSFPSRFSYQVGGPIPPAQSVVIGSTTGALQYSAVPTTLSGGAWLAVSPSSGSSPQALSISVNPGSLPPGTYSGAVSVSAAGAANSPVSIPVTLTVSTTSSLTASVQSLHFNYQLGGSQQVIAKTIGVYSGTPVEVSVSAATSTCGSNWLRTYTESFTTPGAVTVAIEPVGFSLPVDCSGVVTFTPAGSGNPLQIPITLKVASTPLFNFTPAFLNFSAPFDGSPTAEQEVSLTMTSGPGVQFSATAATINGGLWLRVNPGTGTTPGTIRVSADPLNLSVGTYSGSISLSSSAFAGVQAIPVSFRITSNLSATVSPSVLTFTQAVGAAPPPAQTLTLSSGVSSTPFAVTTSTNNAVGWLSTSPNTGSTPNSISVAVNGANLALGNYTGSVTLTLPAAANSPITVPVTLNIVPVRSISTATTSLAFTYRAGTASPGPQTVRVTATGDPANLTASVSGGSWLRVSPAAASTPANFEVSVVPDGLATGNYAGTVEITAPGIAGSPIRIPVTFSVLSAPAPALTDLYNAASGLRGALAPGEIITIMGAGLGPTPGVEFQLTPQNKVPTTLAGVRVLFEDIPGPLLYVSATQINVIVPYEVASMPSVRVHIEYNGVRSPSLTYQVAAVAPGLFTASSTGRGQGSILNQDSTYNAQIPAEKGSVIQIFGTGDGVSVPPLETGSVTPDLRRTAANVAALVGGFQAAVEFAGPAPLAVAGLFQVNVRIPQNVASGNVPVVLIIGGVSTQSGVTVSIR